MKKYDKALKLLILISGIFALVCYGCYLLKMLAGFTEGPLPIISCILVISGVCLPIKFNSQLKRLLGKAYIVFKSVYCFALCFYMISFTAFVIFICSGASSGPAPEKLPSDTVFVTFGSKINSDKTPAVPLKRRLDKTAELMGYCEDSVVIVTGGKGYDEPVSEASVMRDYLISKGISSDRIILEDKAGNTVENVKFAKEICEGSELSGRKIACISTGFHIPRIMLIAERADFADFFYRAPGSRPFFEFTSLVREYMSYAKLFIMGH